MSVRGAEYSISLISIPTTSALSQLDVGAYASGTLAYVAASGQYYSLQKAASASTGSLPTASGGVWVPAFSGTGS